MSIFKNKKDDVEKIAREAKREFCDQIVAWHEKMKRQDAEIASVFDLSKVEEIHVNFWDDFAEGEETYAYVEMGDAPWEFEFDVLNHIFQFAKSLPVVASGQIKLKLWFHDSSTVHPILIGIRDAEFSLYKRWQLIISGANGESLEKLAEDLKSAPAFNGKPLSIYSES